ncbi:MAG: 2-amino-4-hydroxy-6-hydroxymethyldihydropteridine diphosphokinase [Jannaschia sp.]
MTVYLISLGANSGVSRSANARKVAGAGRCLAAAFGRGLALSSLFATPAWPPGIGPDFVNAAATFMSDQPPERILDRLHGIETRFGRTRDLRWGARILDLDLVGGGGLVRPGNVAATAWINLPPDAQSVHVPDHLLLPHPRLQDRGFVLMPLAEIAPHWRHPLTGRSIAAMAADLPRQARRGIRRLGRL